MPAEIADRSLDIGGDISEKFREFSHIAARTLPLVRPGRNAGGGH
ncbi:MAG: hypothetical protein V3T64_12890 [Myxococcota bacterium]